MNEKTKKTLKNASIIAGCVVGGAGLMYVGYLAGAGCIKGIGYGMVDVGVCKSNTAGCVIDLITIPKKFPWGKSTALRFSKDDAIEAVKAFNKLLQEVN